MSVRRSEGENIGNTVVHWTPVLIQNTVWDVFACLIFSLSEHSEKQLKVQFRTNNYAAYLLKIPAK